MKLTQHLSQIWRVVTALPSPDNERKKLLHLAKLEHLEAMASHEYHVGKARAASELASVLESRIERLRNGGPYYA